MQPNDTSLRLSCSLTFPRIGCGDSWGGCCGSWGGSCDSWGGSCGACAGLDCTAARFISDSWGKPFRHRSYSNHKLSSSHHPSSCSSQAQLPAWFSPADSSSCTGFAVAVARRLQEGASPMAGGWGGRLLLIRNDTERGGPGVSSSVVVVETPDTTGDAGVDEMDA